MVLSAVGLPLCRFCQRPWKPPAGVTASESYCSACSEDRRARARATFDSDGKVTVIRGKFMLRVHPSAVVPTDVVHRRPERAEPATPPAPSDTLAR